MNTQSMYEGQATVTAADGDLVKGGFFASVRHSIHRTLKTIMAAHWQREATRELASLPDYLLRDIGLSRDSVHEVAAGLARKRADAWTRQTGGSTGCGG